MIQTIKISNKEMTLINDLLNLTGDEIYQKYGYKRDISGMKQLYIRQNFQTESKQILNW